MNESKYTSLKLIGAVLLVIGAIGFVWAQYKSARPSQESLIPDRPNRAVEQPRPDFRRDGPPSPEQFAQFREQMFENLGLTPEQRVQIADLDQRFPPMGEGQGREGWQERREAMEQILTPEQREKMRESRQGRMGAMRERLMEQAKVLPPDEREKFEQKLEERQQQWAQRRAERMAERGRTGERNR